jgi:hypothetical protein
MSNLAKAMDHLGRAVDQITAASQNWGKDNRKKQVGGAADSLALVQAEYDKLQKKLDDLTLEKRKSGAALRETQERYAALQVISEAVAARLDNTINQLKEGFDDQGQS